jgi:hypothetical protein
MVRRNQDEYTFEAFQVSSSNAEIMKTKGRLRRCFPGPAITINRTCMHDATFRKPFAEELYKLDKSAPLSVHRIAIKATRSMPEIRDTVNPKLVTEMVMGTLRGIGQPADVPRIWKHMRDDVLWDNALEPWRRSPLWTVLRCAIQTTLMRCDSPEQGGGVFKSFMIY